MYRLFRMPISFTAEKNLASQGKNRSNRPTSSTWTSSLTPEVSSPPSITLKYPNYRDIRFRLATYLTLDSVLTCQIFSRPCYLIRFCLIAFFPVVIFIVELTWQKVQLLCSSLVSANYRMYIMGRGTGKGWGDTDYWGLSVRVLHGTRKTTTETGRSTDRNLTFFKPQTIRRWNVKIMLIVKRDKSMHTLLP